MKQSFGKDERIFEKLDKIETLIKNQNPTTEERELEEITLADEQKRNIETLLKDCSEFGGFEIDDEYGFIAQCQKRGITGELWTPEYLKKFADHLKIGYDEYFVKPDRDEKLNECAEAMKLNEEQKTFLRDEFEALFTEETAEEEEI